MLIITDVKFLKNIGEDYIISTTLKYNIRHLEMLSTFPEYAG